MLNFLRVFLIYLTIPTFALGHCFIEKGFEQTTKYKTKICNQTKYLFVVRFQNKESVLEQKGKLVVVNWHKEKIALRKKFKSKSKINSEITKMASREWIRQNFKIVKNLAPQSNEKYSEGDLISLLKMGAVNWKRYGSISSTEKGLIRSSLIKGKDVFLPISKINHKNEFIPVYDSCNKPFVGTYKETVEKGSGNLRTDVNYWKKCFSK